MRALRRTWRRFGGWWLLTAAAAAMALLAAFGRVYTGVAAAVIAAVGGALATTVSERGRSRVAGPAASTGPARVYLSRVARVNDPIRLGVHPAAAAETADGQISQVPLFVERDCLDAVKSAVLAGGFVLVVGDSTAG